MKTRKQESLEARESGLKQFTSKDNPCKKCGCMVFFSAGHGKCKECLYLYTSKKRSTPEGAAKEKVSRKKSYEKHFSDPENRKRKSQKDKDYIARVKADPKRREDFLRAKRKIYNKWYQSEHGRKKALENVNAWHKNNPHYMLLRKSMERLGLKFDDAFLDKTKDEVLGYSKEDFISHIESTMQPGMSFDDRSQWQIDHILPVAWFVKNKVPHPELVNCLHNLKDEWRSDNQSKGSKWMHESMSEWDWCYMLQWMVYDEIRFKEEGAI